MTSKEAEDLLRSLPEEELELIPVPTEAEMLEAFRRGERDRKLAEAVIHGGAIDPILRFRGRR